MPRYFLNLRRGPGPAKLTIDPEGDEIADESLLRAHALRVAGQVIKTRSHAVRDWMDCSFEIMDEHDRLVLILPFTDLAPDDAEAGVDG
jgi:hypothetical protein